MASTTPIPRPTRQRPASDRDSVLRASIFDTALQLGVGSNATVANWIFNPVEEGDEDAESILSPSLTYASTATSEESSLGAYIFPDRTRPGAAHSTSDILPKSPSNGSGVDRIPYSSSNGLSETGLAPEVPAQRVIHFDLSSTPEPRSVSPMPPVSKSKKLRKARPDGYESDGGYVSDGAKAEKPKKSKDKKKKAKDAKEGNASEYESDGGHLSEVTKKKSKDKKDKKKRPESPVTDGESDGGYMSVGSSYRGKKDKKSFKSAGSGDESDGAYLSEASSKKKRFFRMGTRSKKKQAVDSPVEEVPPVPSLPPMMLPIAERFARSGTPSTLDTERGEMPSFDIPSTSSRTSDETSIAESHSSPSTLSSRGLTGAFCDAESVRSPSIDVLSTFKRIPNMSQPPPSSTHTPSSPNKKPSSPLGVSPHSLPNLKRNPSKKPMPPQISVPNTSSLVAARHTPVPLMLTPPTPNGLLKHPSYVPSEEAVDPSILPTNRNNAGEVTVTPGLPFVALTTRKRPGTIRRSPSPTPIVTSLDRLPPPLPSPVMPSTPTSSQTLIRPHVLAYYDIPPPSPPPLGPLPRLPPDVPRHSPSMQNDSGSGSPRSAQAASAFDRSLRPPPSPVWKSVSAPATQPPSPYRSPSRTDLSATGEPSARTSSNLASAPLFLQRVPSHNQRGRDLPFPAQPVLPREESAELVRRTSRPSSRNSVRASHYGSEYAGDGGGGGGPVSAGATLGGPGPAGSRQQLDVHWQPRSASALEVRRVRFDVDDDQRRSWVDYDNHSDESHGVRGSVPDVDSVLSVFRSGQTEQDVDVAAMYSNRNDGEADRSTVYYLEDGSGVDHRYSVWSETHNRASILDPSRSGDLREKFVKRVEAMYAKGDSIPPVPKLPVMPGKGAF